MTSEIMWIIKHINLWTGFYGCTYATRKEAIAAHTKRVGQNWEVCQSIGDRVVKVKVTDEF